MEPEPLYQSLEQSLCVPAAPPHPTHTHTLVWQLAHLLCHHNMPVCSMGQIMQLNMQISFNRIADDVLRMKMMDYIH